MPELPANRRLDQPRSGRKWFDVDPDSFARISERVARFLGTGRYLAIQTVIVIVWIVLNLVLVALVPVLLQPQVAEVAMPMLSEQVMSRL